eukprot:7914813-Alexandrium_andersonii.AAC.1
MRKERGGRPCSALRVPACGGPPFPRWPAGRAPAPELVKTIWGFGKDRPPQAAWATGGRPWASLQNPR